MTTITAQSAFHHLARWLWRLIVFAIVLLALYVSTGRWLVSHVAANKQVILMELNARLPFVLEAEQVAAEWRGFSPELVLSGLRISRAEPALAGIELAHGRARLNIWRSLLRRSPRLARLSLEGIQLPLELTAAGKLQLSGSSGESSADVRSWASDFIQTLDAIELVGGKFSLALPNGEQREFQLDLLLKRKAADWRLQGLAEVISTGSRIQLAGEGQGNPVLLKSLSGDLYLNAAVEDLESLRALLPATLLPDYFGMAGSTELEGWLQWVEGVPSLTVSVAGSGLSLRDKRDATYLLADADLFLRGDIALHRGGWDAQFADLSLVTPEARLELPRLQLAVREEAFTLRAERLDLAPAAQLIGKSRLLPEKLRDAVLTLAPSGTLQPLSLRAALGEQPFSRWQLDAGIDGLKLSSWRGAPSTERAAGYMSLTEAGGDITIDARKMTLGFPAVYRDPLRFDAVNGRVNIRWNEEAVVLDSGLISGSNAAGAVQALFGLQIPLQPSVTGVEMSLLVGVSDSYVAHRATYLPYTLDERLLGWLQRSIGEGRIQDGAFLWRGSLRKGMAPYRTVQLYFNVSDTSLRFDPQWPPLTRLNGIVLVDDAQVSAWVDDARIEGAVLSDASIEVWPDAQGRLTLGVRGRAAGEPGDGLAVINQSPLSKQVKDAFVDWQLEGGSLRADLALQLHLDAPATDPQVTLTAALAETDLRIDPGALAIQQISGELDYQSGRGLRSRDLQGELWGETLTVAISPLENNVATQIALAADVSMRGVRDWLDLPLLELAAGVATTRGELMLVNDSIPQLILTSDMSGVTLDLPAPWGKAEDTASTLRVELPLGGEQPVLQLNLGEELYLDLGLEERAIYGLSLGFAESAVALVPGEVRVGGWLEYANAGEWQDFLSRYGLLALGQTAAQASAPAAVTGSADPGAQQPDIARALSLQIGSLYIGQLELGNQQFDEVALSLAQGAQSWALDIDTPAVSGSGEASLDFATLQLRAARVDLSQLLSGDEAGLEIDPATLAVPTTELTVDALHWGDRALGNLALSLRSDEQGLQIENIRGSVAELATAEGVPARMRWWTENERTRTRFEGNLNLQDAGDAMAAMGYRRSLETRRGSLGIELSWDGSPADLSLETGEGRIDVALRDGRFLETGGAATGALRVLAVLNIAEYLNRLSLDVSDLFGSGVPFESLDGRLLLADQMLDIDRFVVKGRSSRFELSGIADARERTMEGELAVTLPVANNLPWIAALLGGIPVAAGVFVISRLFEDQMDRLASAVYEIDGSWDDPNIAFKRMFDNNSRREIGPQDIEEAVQRSDDANVTLPDPNSPDQVEDPGEAPDESAVDPNAAGNLPPARPGSGASRP